MPGRPSSAPSAKPPHPSGGGGGDDSSSELLQLRLENQGLRARLDDAGNEESRAELLQLLEEQTSLSNSLQHKCDELHRGFVDIDRERRALRKSADDARADAALEVEQVRSECAKKIHVLERHLAVREKEVDKLCERTREQERRIEVVVGESNDRRAKIEEMEGELEELIGMVEGEREGRKAAEGKCDEMAEAIKQKEDELHGARLMQESLEKQVEEGQQEIVREEGVWKGKEEELTAALTKVEQEVASLLEAQQQLKADHEVAVKAMQDELRTQKEMSDRELEEKEQELASLAEDLEQSKTEHDRAVQALQGEMADQKANFASQQQTTNELYQTEKSELVNTLQAQIDAKSTAVSNLVTERDELRSSHAAKVAELEASIEQSKEETRGVEKKYSKSLQTITELQDKHQLEREEMKAANHLLETESGELAEGLDRTKARLAAASEKLRSVESEYTALTQEHATLRQGHSRLERRCSALEGQVEQLTAGHEEALSLKSQRVAALEQTLNDEQGVSNKLREQLREANIQLKEDGSAWQKEKHALETELENVRHDLSMKENEANDVHARLQKELERHAAEVEALRSDHGARLLEVETRGADVVSDLEEAMVELEKELADAKSKANDMQRELEAAVVDAAKEKDRLERTVAEKARRINEVEMEHEQEMARLHNEIEAAVAESVRKVAEQDGKIESLAAYAKDCKEEAKVARAELARVKLALDNRTGEHEEAIAAIEGELQDARELHEREMADLMGDLEKVRSELAMATERDGELEQAKSKLSERTNLLRDMVNQTTSYKDSYETEHARANQLDDAARGYKKQAAEARAAAQRLESEIRDKDTQYAEAMRNERQQRRAAEFELESSQKMAEDAQRKNVELEKENTMLKDKVSRQERYISRLQDREKQNRRGSTMGAPASQGHLRGASKIVRPSTGTHSPVRSGKDRVAGRHRASYAADENERPNVGRFGVRSQLERESM